MSYGFRRNRTAAAIATIATTPVRRSKPPPDFELVEVVDELSCLIVLMLRAIEDVAGAV